MLCGNSSCVKFTKTSKVIEQKEQALLVCYTECDVLAKYRFCLYPFRPILSNTLLYVGIINIGDPFTSTVTLPGKIISLVKGSRAKCPTLKNSESEQLSSRCSCICRVSVWHIRGHSLYPVARLKTCWASRSLLSNY